MRVLIVEDDRSVGSVLQEFLHELGHESARVLSAEGSLYRLAQNRRDADRGETGPTTVGPRPGGIKSRSARELHPVATVELPLAPPGGGGRFEVACLLVRVDVDGYVFHFANLTQDQLERLTLLVRRLAASSRLE